MGARRRCGSVTPCLLTVSTLAGVCLSTRAAFAIDGEATSDTQLQLYDVRSPTGEVIVPRHRLTTTLGLAAYDLLSRREGPDGERRPQPELTFRLRVRYDADFGTHGVDASSSTPSRFVPGFHEGALDLMYGYLEGRRLFGGWLGFKAGRQYTTDALGWYAFDGGSLRVTTPWLVAGEAFGGLEARSGMPFTTARWDADGLRRGDRAGYDPSQYAYFQPSAPAPAWGAAVETVGLPWLHARASWRRVQNTGKVGTIPFSSALFPSPPADGSRLSQERFGVSADATVPSLFGAHGGLAFDVRADRVASAWASLDAFASGSVTVSADYDFYVPTFDADSIWTFFTVAPMNDVGLRANLDVADRLALSASGQVKVFGQGAGAGTGPTATKGGALAGRYRWPWGSLAVRGSGHFGDGTQRVGGDLAFERTFETRWLVTARGSLWQWDDRLRPGRDATSVGYVAGMGYRFSPRTQVMGEWEHEVNRLAGQRLRFVLWLTVAAVR